ncbi:PAS domain S-box protein [bacterium]|nr:PAS domain S-box protein [bacterium]MBU1434851.1 PAS domain S-box protein [bacterium]MBU1503956.1 PAS domain S-box protein [bacterium]
MSKNLKSKKEVNLLIVVFIIIGMLGIGVKYFEFYHVEIMSTTTADIYEHPLKVSNAALTIQVDVYKIHRDMKDIVLSLSNQELLALIEEVDKHERRVYENLSIIEHNVCCEEGLKLHKKVKELFDAWKPIRDEVIALVKNAKKDDAIAITKGKGAKHVLKFEAAAFALNAFAQDKAIGFKNKSESSFQILKTINASINLLFFFLFVVISYYIIHRISKYISKNEHLNNLLSVIRDVNQLIVREKDIQTLIQDSCSILTSTHIYSNAWIVTYDENSEIEYIAGTHATEKFMLFKEKLNQGWVPYCMDKTVHGNNLYSFVENTKNSCSECPLKDEYKNKSAFNIALKHHDKLYGYLTLSIDTKYLGDKDELALLDEVAEDIAYALYNLRIEQQFKVQEERYRYAIEGTKDGLWDWNLLSNSLYFSPRWKEILGYSDEELENSFKTWEERVHPDDLTQALSDIQAAKKSPSGHYKSIHRLKHKDGHWIWIEAKAKIIFDEQNQPLRIVGSCIDITDAKESEDKIVRLKDLYDNVIDSIDNLIFVKDVNLVYIACNRGFEKFIGKPKDQIIGKTDYDIVDKELADFFREHDKTMLLNNRATSNFEWVTYPDGHKVYLFTLKSPLVNAKGEVIGLVGNSADLTEQKEAEHALYIETKRYEAAEKIANVGSWEYNINTQEFWASSESVRIYGFPEDSHLFTTEAVEGCIPDRERVHQALVDLLEKGTEYKLEFEVQPFDGSATKIISSIAEVEKNESGEPYKVVGFIQDITKQIEIKNKLQISNDKYEKAFNSTPNIIIISNLQTGKFYEINKTCEHILGYSREELIGKTTFDINLWADFNDRTEYLEELKKNGSVDNAIYSFNKKNGDKIIANVYASIVTIDDEKYILAVADDITHEYITQELLQQKKRELETIFNEAPNPMMLHNEEGKVLMINKVWEKLTGYSFDEIDTIEKWTKNAYGEKMSVVQENINALYGFDSAVDEGEYPIHTKNGDIITWQFSSAPIGIIDGKRSVISSAMDITELKRKDEMLITQSRLAAMGEMIGMIAHQWRQPLTVISMSANNMILDIALDDLDAPHIKEYSDEILLQTQHLSKTIDDFRNFFKSDKSLVQVKIQEILEKTYAIVKDSLLNHNITLQTSYASESEVNVYPRELMQVFVNLINNAKDALILKKCEDAQIDVKVFEDEEYVITEICDNGDGIDEAILSKIFDPYFTTKDEKTGTGLGLYMSKMIINEHLHGTIEAFNQATGACFRVKLRK